MKANCSVEVYTIRMNLVFRGICMVSGEDLAHPRLLKWVNQVKKFLHDVAKNMIQHSHFHVS